MMTKPKKSARQPAMLSAQEFLIAVRLIAASKPCVLEVSDLHGDNWVDGVPDKGNYGRRFYQSVKNGQLPRIIYHGRRLDNHREYEIVDALITDGRIRSP